MHLWDKPTKNRVPAKQKNERRQPDTWSEGAAQAEQVRQTFYDTPKVTYMNHDAPRGSSRGWAAPAQSIGTTVGVLSFSKHHKRPGGGGVGCPHAYLQRQPQRPPPPLIPAYRLRRGGRVSGGSCRQRAPGRHHVEESRLGKVGPGVTHTPPAASHGTDSINTNVTVPQRKRATSTTWDGTVGAGCRARPVQGPRVPPTGPTPGLHLSFTAIHP